MKNKIFVGVLCLAAMLILPTLSFSHPEILVVPLMYDFGRIAIGTSSTTIITISNTGAHDLVISEITFGGADSPDIFITRMPQLPAVLPPPNGHVESIEVEIAYRPSSEGYSSASLRILSNDPDNSLVTVDLYGEGVNEQPHPVTVEDILAFFDQSVIEGTLEGKGRGKAALARLFVFRKSIEIAGKFIERGRVRAACGLLWLAYRRSDGIRIPPDFIRGDATPELNTMIFELISTIGCF